MRYIFYQPSHISPLTFDRVNTGRAPTSSFPIFRLPIELFSLITEHLTHSDVASLALVDRASRQLAHSIQFASVEIGMGEAGCALLSHLLLELQERLRPKHGLSTQATIGTCIRRLVVDNISSLSSHSSYFQDLAKSFGQIEELRRLISERSKSEGSFVAAICAAIQGAMPNLYILEWNRSITMSPQLINCIAQVPIRHLKFHQIVVDILYPEACLMDFESHKWALETLDIGVLGIFGTMGLGDKSCFGKILHSAAPTLRVLAWRATIPWLPWRIDSVLCHNAPPFPVLDSLILDSVGVHEDAFATFMGPNTQVRSLFIDTTATGTSTALRGRGRVPSLTRFHWLKSDVEDHHNVLAFLDANPQLQIFSTAGSLTAPFIRQGILPRLGRLQHLTSLCLIWDEKWIPMDSLEKISTMKTLKHLWISAGDQTEFVHDWEIVHRDIRDALKPLQGLKSLVFSQDSYNFQPGGYTGRYYSHKVFPRGLSVVEFLNEEEIKSLDDAKAGFEAGRDEEALHWVTLAWERFHAAKMTSIAGWYRKYLPNLEWCYVGQISMMLEPDCGRDGSWVIHYDSDRRDVRGVLLKEKWERGIEFA